jgi:hypothetical protein
MSDQKRYDCRPPPTLLLSVSRLKIKLKGCNFGTSEVIEAESQAVLNILTEHNFQEAFKKMAESLGMVHVCVCGRELLDGDGGQ